MVRQRTTTNKVLSSGPPNKHLFAWHQDTNRTRKKDTKERERWGKGRRRWPPRAPTPFRGAWPSTPSMRTAAATAVRPQRDSFSLPPPPHERAKCPHLVVRDPRTVERGRLLCMVLCMLQFGLHKHNYCCAYLLSLSLSFSHLHTRSTDFVQVGLVTGIVVVALMCAVVVLAGGYVTPPQ